MTSTCRYEDDKEASLHFHAIQQLAKDLGLRMEDVQGLYEEFLSGVKKTARIKDYLTILVSRQVKESIQSRGSTTVSMEPRTDLSQATPAQPVRSRPPAVTTFAHAEEPMMSGKCPQCGNLVTSLRVHHLDAIDEKPTIWKAATFACPACNTILGSALDQVAHSKWLLAQIKRTL